MAYVANDPMEHNFKFTSLRLDLCIFVIKESMLLLSDITKTLATTYKLDMYSIHSKPKMIHTNGSHIHMNNLQPHIINCVNVNLL